MIGVPFLGKIPIYPEIVQNADTGIPAVTPSEEIAKIYQKIADKIEQEVNN